MAAGTSSKVTTGLVSVVIPAFNAASFIADAVRSAVRNGRAPIEVILVDNNCSDDTVARALAEGPVRVKRCATPGPSAARNAGLDAATGEFVQFLDADDVLPPGVIDRHVAANIQTGADVVYGDFVRATVDLDGSVRTVLKRGRPRVGTRDALAELIGPDDFLPLGAALVRRSAATLAVRFDESVRVVEDVRYWIALVGAGASFARADDEIGLVLREHDSPDRASRVSEPEFYAVCAQNAWLVSEQWRAAGAEIESRRREALISVWMHAAEVLATAGDRRSAMVLRWIAELDPNYTALLRTPHRWLAPVLGHDRTMRVARIARGAIDSLRRRRPHVD